MRLLERRSVYHRQKFKRKQQFPCRQPALSLTCFSGALPHCRTHFFATPDLALYGHPVLALLLPLVLIRMGIVFRGRCSTAQAKANGYGKPRQRQSDEPECESGRCCLPQRPLPRPCPYGCRWPGYNVTHLPGNISHSTGTVICPGRAARRSVQPKASRSIGGAARAPWPWWRPSGWRKLGLSH